MYSHEQETCKLWFYLTYYSPVSCSSINLLRYITLLVTMYNCTTIKKTKITFCLMQFRSHTIFIPKDLNLLLILFISLSVLVKWIYPKEDSRLFQIDLFQISVSEILTGKGENLRKRITKLTSTSTWKLSTWFSVIMYVCSQELQASLGKP